MANARSAGPVYWHTIRYPEGLEVPILNRSSTTEVEPPYRHGRCAILRAPLTRRALVVGRWTCRLDADTAPLRALGMRVIDDNGAGWGDDLV